DELTHQGRQRCAWHEIGAVMSEVDTGERDLRVTGIHETADLIRDALGLETAALAPSARHDAERAAMLAAILHFEERARPPERSRRQIDRNSHAAEVAHLHARGLAGSSQDLLDERGQPRLVGIAHHEIHPSLAPHPPP